jgi:hypothetical protein
MRVQVAPRSQSVVLGRWATSSLFAVSCVIAALAALWGVESNADWEAYQYLFYEGGGWLLDTGRDVGFIALQNLLAQAVDYEGFRLVVAVYFVAFTFWLLNAWRPMAIVDRHLIGFVALLPLLYPRFTVQIREGIAITLVLAAFTLMERAHFKRRSALFLPLILMLAAATVHGGVAIFAGLVLVAAAQKALRLHSTITVFFGGLLVLAAAGAQVAYSVWASAAENVADSVYSGYKESTSESDAAKAVYWMARCFMVWYLAVLVRKCAGTFAPLIANFLRLSAYVIVPLVQVVTVSLIFSGQSAYVASAAIRLLNLVFFVTLALVAFRVRKTWPLLAMVAVLLADQQRVMMASLAEL